MSKIYTPAEMGLDAPRYAAMQGEDQGVPEGIVLHWPASKVLYKGGVKDSSRALQAFERYHIEKHGWRGLAYDEWFDLAGLHGLIRGTGQSGATSGDYDEDGVPNNRETDAFLLILGESQKPSKAMIERVRQRIIERISHTKYVIGHRNAKGTVTECPGEEVMRKVVAPAQQWLLEEDDMLSIKLIRIDGGDTVYICDGTERRPIPSVEVANAMWPGRNWRSEVVNVTAKSPLAKLPVRNPRRD